MHYIISQDGSVKEDPWVHWIRSISYLLIGTAGVLLLCSPLLVEVYSSLARAMSLFLAVGGGLSFLGSITKRWVGEFIGLPLLTSSFAVFAFISTQGSWEIAPYIAAANFLILMGISASITARWRHSWNSYRLAVHFAKNPPGEMDEDYE